MKPRIAIPVPTSTNPEYNQRAWPIYAQAVERSGGEPIEIPLTGTPAAITNLINTCQAVLLPGSPADVNPHKFGADPIPECSPSDPARENVDELLIQDAHNLYKPILAICFGAQSLNVWRGGTLVQHIDPAGTPINHRAGRDVAIAHSAAIEKESTLGGILKNDTPEEAPEQNGHLNLRVNSSHHQAIATPGDGLRITARCPEDGIIEAVEGGLATNPNSEATGNPHWVVGIQWHPERSYDISPASQAIFKHFVHEAAAWTPRAIHTSVAKS